MKERKITEDGNVLYSDGKKAVLVGWKLGDFIS
jgi:hypothetical protein